MKIKFDVGKMTWAITGILAVVGVGSFIQIHYALWVLPIFLVFLFLALAIKPEFIEGMPWIWTGILYLGGAILSTYSIQFLLLTSEDFNKTKDEIWAVNMACALVVYLFVLLISNNVGIGCAISNILLLLFGFIDYFVYQFRGNEFSLADIKAAATGLSVASRYSFNLTPNCVYVIMAAIVFCVFSVKCKIKFEHPWWMRGINVLFIVLCVVGIIFNAGDRKTETWEMKGTYRNGYLLNFALQVRDSVMTPPEGYSAEAVEELETKYDKTSSAYAQADVENPTIIVVMNESFADLTVIGDFDTNVSVTPFMDSLSTNTMKGYALSSVYGAKTPNSEWEFLSGNSMAFLPEGSVVYQQYLSKTPTTLVSTLKNIGYTCVAMHPYYETGWSRNKVYPNMGFDEMYFMDDFDQNNVIREYITDQELYDGIIDRFENKEASEKLFLMSITMQNHGGYTTSYDNFDEDVYKMGTSYTDANQYLSLIHESDKALENLITYFEGVDEPVEIVFFGDHQPGLYSKFYTLLNGQGVSNLSLDQLEDLYTVPFFIWTNYKTEAKKVDITSLNYLSTLTLERAGIDLPAYNQFLAEMMKDIPAINSRGYYSSTYKKYIHLDEATEDEAEWISMYNVLEYNSMFDKKNRSSLFFPYLE